MPFELFISINVFSFLFLKLASAR